MNRPPSSNPAERARAAQRRRTRSNAAGLTQQQMIILVLVGLAGMAALALAAYLVLSSNPTLPPAAPIAALPSTQTPVVGEPPQPAPAQTQAPPVLPDGCSPRSSGFSQGIVMGVQDDATLQVQIDGQLSTVGFAGIEVFSNSGSKTAQKVREMLEGQPVALIRDVSENDTEGRLVRYVFAGERFINFELVRQGLAAAQPASPDQACAAYLLQAEQQARAEKLGGWSPAPVPTRTFIPFVDLDSSGACDCSRRYECSDFATHDEAQTCYNACNDYNSKLDDDRDGIACEYLP